MTISVVVPVYNQSGVISTCLDSLARHAPETEVIVVNGPSTDGTAGIVSDHPAVDIHIECSTRRLSIARNAGIAEASGEIIAIISPAYAITKSWVDAIVGNLTGTVDATTGPVHDNGKQFGSRPQPSQLQIDEGNLALTRGAITALDGFDEYLLVDGAADLTARLRGLGLQLVWHPAMQVQVIQDTSHPAGQRCWEGYGETAWGVKYRSIAYRAVKNNGLRPRVMGTIGVTAIYDGAQAAKGVVRGTGTPTTWISNGVQVIRNVVRGAVEGRRARKADESPTRNPHGISQSKAGEAVAAVHQYRSVFNR